MSTTIQHSMARLRTQMLRAAKAFPDYNFRQYFIRQVREQFSAMEAWAPEAQQQFLVKDGARNLKEMRRMALVNRLYSTQPVYLDRKAQQKETGKK